MKIGWATMWNLEKVSDIYLEIFSIISKVESSHSANCKFRSLTNFLCLLETVPVFLWKKGI